MREMRGQHEPRSYRKDLYLSRKDLYPSIFHKAKKDAAVEASYVVSELIAKAGKPFTEGPFLKDCMMKVADILCPEKRACSTI